MSFTYYNQRNYGYVPYPTPSKPNATVASSGCGVCCASMVMSVFGINIPIADMAKKAIAFGARSSTGTDMGVLSKSLQATYGVKRVTTDDVNVLKEHLSKGHIAICNVGGDRAGYRGVFSNGGHYIVAYGLTSKVQPVIYDPGYYSGKYSTPYRTQYVTVGENHQLYTTFDVLDKDCSNRSPRYYIFYKEGANVSDKTPITDVNKAKEIIKEKAGLTNNTILFIWSYRYGDDLLLKLANAMV